MYDQLNDKTSDKTLNSLRITNISDELDYNGDTHGFHMLTKDKRHYEYNPDLNNDLSEIITPFIIIQRNMNMFFD